jgi:hypothetical protein
MPSLQYVPRPAGNNNNRNGGANAGVTASKTRSKAVSRQTMNGMQPPPVKEDPSPSARDNGAENIPPRNRQIKQDTVGKAAAAAAGENYVWEIAFMHS